MQTAKLAALDAEQAEIKRRVDAGTPDDGDLAALERIHGERQAATAGLKRELRSNERRLRKLRGYGRPA